MGEKMNKTIKLVGTGFIGVVCSIYITFSIIHMTRVNSKMDEWNESYKAIEEDVSAFIKVSDPKTIRLYVKELNKILDEIHFLSKIVKSGQLADESLTSILDEQQDINKRLGDIITKYDQYIVKANNRDESLGYHVDELWEWTFLKEETDSTRNKSLVDKLNLIQANLDNIEGLIKEIQDSKINKFW